MIRCLYTNDFHPTTNDTDIFYYHHVSATAQHLRLRELDRAAFATYEACVNSLTRHCALNIIRMVITLAMKSSGFDARAVLGKVVQKNKRRLLRVPEFRKQLRADKRLMWVVLESVAGFDGPLSDPAVADDGDEREEYVRPRKRIKVEHAG